MKRRLTIEFKGIWVLSHRGDGELPVEYFEKALQSMAGYEKESSSLGGLTCVLELSESQAAALPAHLEKLFKAKYPDDNPQSVYSVRIEDLGGESTPAPSSSGDEKAAKVMDGVGGDSRISAATERLRQALGGNGGEPASESMSGGAPEELLKQMEQLVGGAEFKALMKEIVSISKEIKRKQTFDVFSQQCYLFSIGDGYGLTTYLSAMAKLVELCGLKSLHSHPLCEVKIAGDRFSADAFDDAKRLLDSGDEQHARVLCIDISEWMDKTNTGVFKEFLRAVEKHVSEFIIVFRVPFVDKAVLSQIRYSLNDLLFVRAISFPPFNREELKECALLELNRYRYSLAEDGWRYFYERIAEEKSDGKFYGLNTIKKVMRELIYQKHIYNAKGNLEEEVITVSEAKSLCAGNLDSGLTGMQQLERMVGNEQIKTRVLEIIAQIEMAMIVNSEERPCLHMRFVGNPGTGKTTVARILGKILKEKGVLRIGNFYEYAGRDFCGRYIGETAPKTTSICRDAYGSVLFIDEAYSLYRGNDNDKDYGREAIDTLIAEMENHRNDLVVIMAGYTDEMNTLMEANQGLASRMPYTVEFPNFTREQLYEIFCQMAQEKFECEPVLLESAKEYFLSITDETLQSKAFSNARFVRNVFERTWAKAAMRCQLDKQTKVVLTKADFDRAIGEKDLMVKLPKATSRLGFY